MATITKGKTFISGETVEPSDLHQLVDSATVTGIVNADIDAAAAIAASKLALTGAITDTQLATGAVTGAAGGGKLAASAINSQTVIADPLASTDEFLVWDASASALRKVSWSSMQPVGSVLKTDYVELVGTQTYTGNTIGVSAAITSTSGHQLLSSSFGTSSSANHVIVSVSAFLAERDTAAPIVMLVFANSTLIASRHQNSGNYYGHFNLIVKHSPASTTPVTYSVRAGAASGALFVNRQHYYDDYVTGVQRSSMLIQEIKG